MARGPAFGLAFDAFYAVIRSRCWAAATAMIQFLLSFCRGLGMHLARNILTPLLVTKLNDYHYAA